MAINSLRLTLCSSEKNYHHSCIKNSVIIGRSLKSDFNVAREDLSREHCRIDIEGNEIFITDLSSKNGVAVDGIRIPVNKKVKITPSSLVVLSNVYTLKLNSLEVKTKADMVYSKPSAAPDIETLTYQLDLSVEKEEKKSRMSMRKLSRNLKEETADLSKRHDFVKMILTFLAVFGIILYQAFGR